MKINNYLSNCNPIDCAWLLSFSFSCHSYRSKQTLAKAVKKVVRVLPENPDRRQQVLERIVQEFGLLPKTKAKRTNAQLSDLLIENIEEFYTKDFISWQAPGKRDYITMKENGIKVKHQKRHLLYNLREVYELFLQENPSKQMTLLSNLWRLEFNTASSFSSE